MQKIQQVKLHPKENLFEKLRQVKLRGYNEFVYEKSEIESFLCFIDAENVFPVQRYVLKRNLERIRDLRESILQFCLGEEQYDILNLEGYLTITFDYDYRTLDILPPIIERKDSWGKDSIRYICDGIHRIFLSKLEWINPIRAVLITAPSKPYYAFPVNEYHPWRKIEILDKIPEGFLKRWYRGPREEAKKLFRDFDSAFNVYHEGETDG